MKFRFVISKTENLFFFISNLSEWHFSCRLDYNEACQALTGPLSNGEKKSLRRFKAVMQQRGFSYRNGKSIYLGMPFFIPTEGRKWKAITEFLDGDDLQIVKEAFHIFTPRFEKTWEQLAIKNWQRKIDGELRKDNVRNMFAGIEHFLGGKSSKLMKVHLIASPSIKRSVSGGANLGKDDITLEVPVFKLNDWNVGSGVSVLAHEAAHTFVDGNPIQRILSRFLRDNKLALPRFISKDREPKNFLQEIITESCAPFGYFCSGVFRAYEPTTDVLLKRPNVKFDNYDDLMKVLVWELYPVVAFYHFNHRGVDKDFLKFVHSFLNILVNRKCFRHGHLAPSVTGYIW
ncbi:MAG: hypothetical protein V1696_01195 [Candidatus Jorgensenbacteria bacterium]